MTLSVCLIVKNEEKVLERCLSCVQKIAEEIIVVDTGSTDESKKIAKKFTDKVFDFEWVNDFSKARNFAFSKATCDYIMWLDADDIILDGDIEKILKLKNEGGDADVFMLKYVTGYDENFKPTFSFYRERILKRSKNFVWQDPVHEVITPSGKIEYLDICVYHAKVAASFANRNLLIYQDYIAKGHPLSARQRFYYARELYYNNLIEEAILNLNLFLSLPDGWIENQIEASKILSLCYMRQEKSDKALSALFNSFIYSKPRAEILCQIGQIYKNLKRYDEAIYYFKLAKAQRPNLKNGGFVELDNYRFTPNLELCVCYFYKGHLKRAKHYHSLTKKEKPEHPSVKFNDRFFKD